MTNKKVAILDLERVCELCKKITGYIRTAHFNIMRSVNVEQVSAYWCIGRDIVQEEQRVNDEVIVLISAFQLATQCVAKVVFSKLVRVFRIGLIVC